MKNIYQLRWAILTMVISVCISCSANKNGMYKKVINQAAPSTTIKEQRNITIDSDLELIWQDEFLGDVLDNSKWDFQIGNGVNGWGNNELQFTSKILRNKKIYYLIDFEKKVKKPFKNIVSSENAKKLNSNEISGLLKIGLN